MKTKTTLEDLFQKFHGKETISKTIQITINSYCFPNSEYVLYLMNLSILPTKRRHWMMEHDKMLFANDICFQN